MRLDELPVWFLRVAALTHGLLWGSFLNVVIYRVPLGMSVAHPPSHCPACGKPIAPYDNVPVFSYIVLRGRARCCGARMSPRYPLVELMGGLLSLAVLEAVIFALPGSTSVGRAAAIYGADFALSLGLVAAAFIDLEHMILPDSITLGGLVLGVATASLRDQTFTASLGGAAAGFLGVWLPFNFLYKGLLGRTGMGMGDAKLVALAGAWFGWQGAVFTLVVGALQGSLYALVAWLFGIEHKLPEAVQKEIDELRRQAAEGDVEAQKLLDEDPVTEDENDAFILTFFARAWRWLDARVRRHAPPAEAAKPVAPEAPPAAEEQVEAPAEPEPMRARIPFGPFLSLACLELLLAGNWIATHFAALLRLPD